MIVNGNTAMLAGLAVVTGNVLFLMRLRRRSHFQKRNCTEPLVGEAESGHIVRLDPLTGIPDRDYIANVLPAIVQLAQSRGIPVGVLKFDIDHFQLYNAEHGIDAGDESLRAIALIARQKMRAACDRLVYFGNGRFIVILPDSDLQDAAHVAERIRHHVEASFRQSAAHHPLTISVAVVAFTENQPVSTEHLAAQMRLLTERLHRAKRAGRNSSCYTDDGFEGFGETRERNRLMEELREAVIEDEFLPWFQPQCAFQSGDIIAYEALVRWQHPRLGLTMPGTFIGLAEESGVIVRLGAWILKAACQEAQRWPDTIRVAVNVSAVQFERPGLFETVLDALLTSGLSPERLELELTENVALTNSAGARETLNKIKTLGVSIALDDFGTGYSSLTYLQQMQFDKLKIDRSFVSQAIDGPHSQTIIRAVIHLAHSLNMRVVAEGIETAEQFELLRENGCDAAQGYWIGRPGPASGIAARHNQAGLAHQRIS